MDVRGSWYFAGGDLIYLRGIVSNMLSWSSISGFVEGSIVGWSSHAALKTCTAVVVVPCATLPRTVKWTQLCRSFMANQFNYTCCSDRSSSIGNMLTPFFSEDDPHVIVETLVIITIRCQFVRPHCISPPFENHANEA